MPRIAEEKKAPTARMLAARDSRRKAYSQRNELLALLARIYAGRLMPTGGLLDTLTHATPERKRRVLRIDTPAGPLCYIVTPDEVELYFSTLDRSNKNDWDGATVAIRSQRILALPGPTTRTDTTITLTTSPLAVADTPEAAPPEPRRPGDFSRRRK